MKRDGKRRVTADRRAARPPPTRRRSRTTGAAVHRPINSLSGLINARLIIAAARVACIHSRVAYGGYLGKPSCGSGGVKNGSGSRRPLSRACARAFSVQLQSSIAAATISPSTWVNRTHDRSSIFPGTYPLIRGRP